MKILLVSWMLLMLGVGLNSGHYIRPLEDANSEVYRVTEDHSGVKFVNPKPEKPTLREVLYYHIIERAFGKEDPAITERSFTNSHGLQFLKDSSESIEDIGDNQEEYQANEEDQIEHENELEDEIQDEGEDEEPEPLTETKPLTDQDVKEAYKHRSYLFDQLRQRYSPVKRMILPDSLGRSKRGADYEEIANAPEFPDSTKDAYMQPKTYGMNLDSDGGYVWNNLNNPPTYYEVGQSTENPTEGQNESTQSQETQAPEINVPQVTESTDSGSSEDIYVSTDRQPATPDQGIIEEKPENESENAPENPTDNFESSDAEKPANESVGEDVEPVENPEILESSDADKPIEPVLSDPLPEDTAGVEKPFENTENPEKDDEPIEKPAEELETVGESSTENSDADEPKIIPEAPTLPPLNYDNLPGYIRDTISSTEKSELQEQTENPYVNPQLDPEDKKTVEEKIEDIFATAQPVEDIPRTYGVNLTGDSGKVWNDMVNPPVSYDVGTQNKEEEPTAPEPSEQPNQENLEEPKPEEQPELEIPEQPKPEEQPELEIPEQPKPNEQPDLELPEQPKPNEQPELEIPEDKEEVPELPELENPEPALNPEEKPEGIEDETETAEKEESKLEDEGEAGDELNEPKLEKKPDIMNELLKSDQFWSWLGEWTAFMELLEKHIRKIAIQEICNREKTGTEMCLLNESEKPGLVIKDGKIIIDGKELPITHTSNFDGLRRWSNKKEGNKVDATTIYGNSVGNENVNNIFILNAVDAKEILEEIKPGNDSKIDFIIDEREKEVKNDSIEVGVASDDIKGKIDEISKENDDVEEPIKEEPIKEELIKEEPVKEDEVVKEQEESEDKPISSELE